MRNFYEHYKHIENKKLALSLLFLFLLFATIAIPTLCKMLIGEDNSIVYWDGTVASSYHAGNGTINNPYIIETPSEFAYLSKMVNEGTDYTNVYFKLNNNLYLNAGVFDSTEDEDFYIKDYKKYYIKPETNEIYSDKNHQNNKQTINIFPTITGFKGTIDGNNKHIYGLYITSSSTKEVGLFQQLEGNIKNLYIENSLIAGKNKTGLISSTSGATIDGIRYAGTIRGRQAEIAETKNLKDVISDIADENLILNLPIEIPLGATDIDIKITGDYKYSNSSTTIKIGDKTFNDGHFEYITTDKINQLVVEKSSYDALTLTNIKYELKYNNSITSLIAASNNIEIKNSYSKGKIIGDNLTSGIIGVASGNTSIKNTYTLADVNSKKNASGIIGATQSANLDFEQTYSSANLKALEEASGLISNIDEKTTGIIKNSFTTGTIDSSNSSNFIDINLSQNLISTNNYTTLNKTNILTPNVTYVTENQLLTTNFIKNTLQFLEYNSENSLANDNVWLINNQKLPHLYTDDQVKPTVTINLGDYQWMDFNSVLNVIKNPTESKFTVNYNDKESDILKVEYYVSYNYALIPEDIENIPWEIYNNQPITIDKNGNCTLYLKITDTSLNTRYANTDLIVFDNYNTEIKDPTTDENLEKYNNQVTSKSTVKYVFQRNYQTSTIPYQSTDQYYLKGNIPLNTKIYLVDKYNNESYYTKITESKNTNLYDLKDFQKLGVTKPINFINQPNSYYNNQSFSENFEFFLDFSEASITNQELSLELVILDKNQNIITNSNKETLFIYDKLENEEPAIPETTITTDFKDYFTFDGRKKITIPLTNTLTSKEINDKPIYDSRYQALNLNINLQFLDENKSAITTDDLNNLKVLVNETEYRFNKNGYLLIPNYHKLNSNIEIELTSEEPPTTLKSGTYYIKINETNVDQTIKTKSIFIPVKVENNQLITDYNYKITTKEDDLIWQRNKGVTMDNKPYLDFQILYDSKLKDPNIKVYLYQKVNFSSESQEYQSLNIKDFIENGNSDNSFYPIESVSNHQKETIKFNIKEFSLGGYMLKFKLYDGNTYIGEDTKKIIVK